MNRKHYKILIIDDSAADRRIYRRFLQGQGEEAQTLWSERGYDLEVVEAPTAEAGLAQLADTVPDCIILDYRLPDLDGLAVLDAIQQQLTSGRLKRRVPVIFVTGKPEALLVSEAYRRGAVKYISKDTITSASIREALSDALEYI